jgi:hypothetical protein
VDFQGLLREVLLPEAKRRGVRQLKLILDNRTTHAPKHLAGWLRAEAERQGLSLSMELCWMPTNASWLDQAEIWFSILQRKLLQPNHFARLEELEQAMAQFIAVYNQTTRPINWTYTVEKLETKLGIHL